MPLRILQFVCLTSLLALASAAAGDGMSRAGPSGESCLDPQLDLRDQRTNLSDSGVGTEKVQVRGTRATLIDVSRILKAGEACGCRATLETAQQSGEEPASYRFKAVFACPG